MNAAGCGPAPLSAPTSRYGAPQCTISSQQPSATTRSTVGVSPGSAAAAQKICTYGARSGGGGETAYMRGDANKAVAIVQDSISRNRASCGARQPTERR